MLANRLPERPDRRVLLIEAGKSDYHPCLHVPALSVRAMRRQDLTWPYKDDPDPARNGGRSSTSPGAWSVAAAEGHHRIDLSESARDAGACAAVLREKGARSVAVLGFCMGGPVAYA